MNFSRDNLFSPEELATNFGLSSATLAGWRCERKGPPLMKVGRKIWYPKESFNGWMLQQVQEMTMALRNRNGIWHYRFKLDGKEYAETTGLDAT